MKIDIQKSFRKSITLKVKNGAVLVRAPFFMSARQIEQFIQKHDDWIQEQLSKNARPTLSDEEVRGYKNQARVRLSQRTEYYAHLHNLSYHSVRITSAKTRWGSCSSKKNINFSYRLMMTPEFVQDYVVVHELAHLIHMNHSKSFWHQVSIMYPEYKTAEKWLKENSKNLAI